MTCVLAAGGFLSSRTGTSAPAVRLLSIIRDCSSRSRSVVAFWLLIIFLSFSLIAPRNATATIALIASAISAATAIFLILEFDWPFTGFLRMSNEPMLNVLVQLKQSAGQNLK